MIKDETIRDKKQLFDALKAAFVTTGTNIQSLFKKIDVDNNHSISADELFKAFMQMNLNVDRTRTH